jgi:hypothetical protein
LFSNARRLSPPSEKLRRGECDEKNRLIQAEKSTSSGRAELVAAPRSAARRGGILFYTSTIIEKEECRHTFTHCHTVRTTEKGHHVHTNVDSLTSAIHAVPPQSRQAPLRTNRNHYARPLLTLWRSRLMEFVWTATYLPSS